MKRASQERPGSMLCPVILKICCMALFLRGAAVCGADNIGVTIPVDSPAFVFSPGNWTGDNGRGGGEFRQSWNPGAYFRVTWTTTNTQPTAMLMLDTSGYTNSFDPPRLAYCIDGAWTCDVLCRNEIAVQHLKGAGPHELCVIMHMSRQIERWGCIGQSGRNVMRVIGLRLDEASEPAPSSPAPKWALIVGDSITEGSGATALASYSHLVGQSLQAAGYEYGISACGWSGWLNRGDRPPGDVPGYYVVSGSTNGTGGVYHDALSRWNKIDGNEHSLLDSRGRISAYGATGQEPALILINYGTNDILHRSNPSDTRASILQCLAALRKSTPEAHIVLLIPFGQYYARELKEAVSLHRKSHPNDDKMAVIDLGPGAARALSVPKGPFGGLHPNDRACANFAARIVPQLMTIMGSEFPSHL